MVLVTGASGFLGRHLVRRLSSLGAKVRALYHNRPPSSELKSLPGVEWLQSDLLDVYDVEEAMLGISQVYHCAGIVSFQPQKHKELLHFNPESTAHVVNQALHQGTEKMVCISSVSALGRTGVEKEITEDEEWSESKYNSAYGISKYLAETEVWRGIGEGLNAVILNPGIILGACEAGDPPYQLLEAAWKEFPFYTMGITSWVDVTDVVSAATMLMQSDITAERFIVSAGDYGYREIMNWLADAMNKKQPHISAGPVLAGLAWRISALKSSLSGQPATLTRETARNANTISRYRNTKLTEALPGFSYTPIDKSAAAMARSFINYHKK